MRENTEVGPSQRFLGFLQEVALAKLNGPLVLMVDEIDAVRSLSFSTDEFFAGIRHLHNVRATNPDLQRFTVCLLGAALPSDLVSDPRTTPFNIGKRIGLRDFTPDEVRPLADGLGPCGAQILDRVLYWTAGHPFLTQVLCYELARVDKPGLADVDRLVKERYLDARARDSDTNLADLANRLLGRGDPAVTDMHRADTLALYAKMLRRGIADDEGNPAAARIKMSGAARMEQGRLQSRNRIYSTVFGPAWIRENMPRQETLRQQRAFWAGVLRTGVVSMLAIIIIGCFTFVAYRGAAIDRAAQHKTQLAYDESRRLLGAEGEAKADAIRAAAEARRNLKRERDAEALVKHLMNQEHAAKVAAINSESTERRSLRKAIEAAKSARVNEARLSREVESLRREVQRLKKQR